MSPMISFGSTLKTANSQKKTQNDITDITILTAAAKKKVVISAQAAKAHHAWEWLALQVLPQEIAWVASDSPTSRAN